MSHPLPRARRCACIIGSWIVCLLYVESSQAQVFWLPNADGFWNDPTNWSSDPNLPGPGDDVIIDVGGATQRTVSVTADETVNTLISQEHINLGFNSSLTLLNGGIVNGDLSFFEASLFIGGGTFENTGAFTIRQDFNFLAENGADVTLRNIGFSGVSGGKRVEAQSGARVTFENWATIESPFSFIADGAGSVIDLNSVLNNDGDNIRARNGGQVLIDRTTGSLSVVHSSGQGSLVRANFVESVGTINASDGGQVELASVAYVQDVSAYDTIVSLPSVNETERLFLDARHGGQINLSNLNMVSSRLGGLDGIAQYGATIDLTGLKRTIGETENTLGGQRNELFVRDGSSIQFSSDPNDDLSFTNLHIYIDETSTINTERFVAMDSSRISTRGTDLLFDNLTTYNSPLINAYDGATIQFPSLSSTWDTGGQRRSGAIASAAGPGTLVDLPTVQSIVNSGIRGSWFIVKAEDGGRINLPNVTDLMADPGSDQGVNEGYTVEALGDGSHVDLSSLQRISDTSIGGLIGLSNVVAHDGGTIDFGSGHVQLTNVIVGNSSTGNLIAGTLEFVTDNAQGSPIEDTARLVGNGQLNANVINTSGFIDPSEDPYSLADTIGMITIDGNLTQGIEGTMIFDILNATQFDGLNVTGDLQLDGGLQVLLDDNFDPSHGDEFLIISVDGTRSGIFDSLPQGSQVAQRNNVALKVDYFSGDGNDVRLFAIAIPEPTSTALIAISLLGAFLNRRRRTLQAVQSL